MSSQDDDQDWETDSEDAHKSDTIELPNSHKLCITPPHEWFRDTKGYTQYKDQDKGHLAGKDIFPLIEAKLTFIAYPEHSIPCSSKFLQYILQDLALIYTSHCFHLSDFQSDEALIVLRSIYKEVKRLQNHRELFPSEEVGEQFLGKVYDTCGLVESALVLFREGRIKWYNLVDTELAEVKAASWPTFQAGRNDWHQFLHNGAPGHRSIPKQASNTESMQIIPPGGLNLLQAWQTEIEDNLKTYDEVSKLNSDPSTIEDIR